MTEEEKQTRLILLSLLPPGSPELDAARRALILLLLHTSPQEALELAWGWWPWQPRPKTVPQVAVASQVFRYLPGMRERFNSSTSRLWLDAMLADDACDSAWIAAPLSHQPPLEWPIDALLERASRQPALELLKALAWLCLMAETSKQLRASLLSLFAAQPTEAQRELAEHLGREAIWFPLAHSRVFVEQAREILGETTAARVLLRGVRETRLVLRLRTRRRCRMRWAPRVDEWLAARPQTEFYQALRQEIAYFTDIGER